MLIISGCCKKKYIKNHNLCKTILIILILSFLLGILVSYLQRRTFKELMCIKKIADSLMHAGGRRPPPKPSSEARAGGPSNSSPPPLPRAGGGGKSIMVDNWFHLVCGNTIPVWSKRSIHCERARGATLRSHPQEPPSGATLRSHPQGHRFILDI